ncbi:hypothetical protein EJ08DRAFT_739326 [Tothia fuscella]|uniref:Uncharacterized protein n=1 Tax=Tothia fuscella TaxID=1048955 RepID=A0A9P4NEW3_9PEZI|nr:hypothetical protein EJ08DRAFT_739326 [Tothia fuscella]
MNTDPDQPSAHLLAVPNELIQQIVGQIDDRPSGITGLLSLRCVNKRVSSNVDATGCFSKLFESLTVHVNPASFQILIDIAEHPVLHKAVKTLAVSLACFGPRLLEEGRYLHRDWTAHVETQAELEILEQQLFLRDRGMPTDALAYCLSHFQNCTSVAITDRVGILRSKSTVTHFIPDLLLHPCADHISGDEDRYPLGDNYWRDYHRNDVINILLQAMSRSRHHIQAFSINNRYIDSLELCPSMDFKQIEDSTPLRNSFGSIRTLKLQLSNMTTHLDSDMTNFFACMPHLEDLTLQSGSTTGRRSHNLEGILANSVIPNLKALTLDSALIDSGLLLFFFYRHNESLRRLTLDSININTGEAGGREFFTAMAKMMTLDRLEIEYIHHVDTALGRNRTCKFGWIGADRSIGVGVEGVQAQIQGILETLTYKEVYIYGLWSWY